MVVPGGDCVHGHEHVSVKTGVVEWVRERDVVCGGVFITDVVHFICGN